MNKNIELTIIIKTYNEEEHIEESIISALEVIKDYAGEVILADSLSTDSTIGIARKYPIKIVQLKNPIDRSCGVGPQLGYQHCRGDFVYILDGDMSLKSEFIRHALNLLKNDEKLAGVGGNVSIVGGDNYEFLTRKKQMMDKFKAGPQRWLICGGLYRREAVNSVGYFSNRNLHANEEKELGLRLAAAGWYLLRIDELAAEHYVHDEASFALMKKRWKSKYVNGTGELLRSAFGKSYFKDALVGQLKLIVLVFFWALFSISFALVIFGKPSSFLFLCATLVFMCIFQVVRKKSIYLGIMSIFNIHFQAAGLVRGFFTKPTDVFKGIESVVIKDVAEIK